MHVPYLVVIDDPETLSRRHLTIVHARSDRHAEQLAAERVLVWEWLRTGGAAHTTINNMFDVLTADELLAETVRFARAFPLTGMFGQMAPTLNVAADASVELHDLRRYLNGAPWPALLYPADVSSDGVTLI